ncbi:MAG: ABC transporter permease [Clostridia bacterium]|nr:ABC transporter permease [Clostridia bacterium]
MLALFGTLEVFIKMGLVYSLLAMGYYVSYTLLDFPDLTVEGTFLGGAVTYGLLVTHGCNPWLALILAFLMGAAFGTLTGVLHVKLKIRPLLCGILVSTGLISLNLVATSAGVMGDFRGESASTITYGRSLTTLHNSFPADLIPAKIHGISLRDVLLFLLIALLFKLLLDLFLKTRRGMLLRATGNNAQFVTTLAKDAGNNKILGLAIGNGFAAVSGVLYSHVTGNVNQSMGIGTVVIGLASLIIGLSVFHKVRLLKPTTKVILGAIIYQACLTLVNRLGVPTAYNKLVMALLFVLALILGDRVLRRNTKSKKTQEKER